MTLKNCSCTCGEVKEMTVIVVNKQPFTVVTYKNVTSMVFNPETNMVNIIFNGTDHLHNIDEIKIMIG